MLESRGLIERDAGSAWRSGEPAEAVALDDLIGRSITMRAWIFSPESVRSPSACAAT
jgi:hypothetical protein